MTYEESGGGGGMLAALDVTSRHCRHQMELYGRCVATNPESWQRHCHHLRLDVTRCAAAHCSPQVQDFLLCADQVKPSP
ncbi:coiled-coil-helix-coiled-coil-helix domain-containing protein 5 isoform 2-T3 [Phaethornis superciliosus]